MRATEGGGAVTQHAANAFVGTARYAAPEQITSGLTQAVDHHADIYSLGATMYELVTLQTLYPAESIEDLLQRKLHDEPEPMRSIDKGIPEDLEFVVQKALNRRPEARYASAALMAEDLRALRSWYNNIGERTSRGCS